MKTYTAAIAAILLAVTTAAAQVQIDQKRPASKNGQVRIENSFGSTTVIGWDKGEVAVKGRLATGAEDLDFDADEESVSISVDMPEHRDHHHDDGSELASELEIHVPKGSAVQVETVSGIVSVDGVEGALSIETISGDITVKGSPRAVEIDTVSGTTRIDAAAAEMNLQTVSGEIRVRGASRNLSVSCVSGDLDIAGKDLERARIESISGNVRIEGSFRSEGSLEVEMHSGDVDLVVPADVAARFHLTTYSGGIESDLGPKPRRTKTYSPNLESRFTIGQSDFDVSVQTFSGDITVRVNRAGSPDDTKPRSPGAPPASPLI